MKHTFCPKCHREVKIPDFLKNMNIKGNINLLCEYCGTKNEIKAQSSDQDQQHEKTPI